MSVDLRSVPEREAADTPVVLLPRRYDSPDAWQLVEALHREQLATYAVADDPRAVDPIDFDGGVFLVGYAGARPVACGGLRPLSPETAEIKRMYVVPDHRGHGVGVMLLGALEQAAFRSGRRRIVLETGVRNVRALALYGHTGYSPIAPYVDARDPAINRAFTKLLPPTAAGHHPLHGQPGPRRTLHHLAPPDSGGS